MNKLNLTIKKTLKTSVLLAVLGTTTVAFAGNNSQYNNDDRLKDAWIDGKVETALLINRHLNNFSIDTDVKNNVVYLSGTVKSNVDKELAEEITKGIEGVTNVENNLVIEKDVEMKKHAYKDGDKRSLSTWYDDATITASIKSKYLWNDEVDGTDMNIDTMNGEVTLKGKANSSASSDLAEKIAENTSGVHKVTNKLMVANQE